jgi:hypothetical protein
VIYLEGVTAGRMSLVIACGAVGKRSRCRTDVASDSLWCSC